MAGYPGIQRGVVSRIVLCKNATRPTFFSTHQCRKSEKNRTYGICLVYVLGLPNAYSMNGPQEYLLLPPRNCLMETSVFTVNAECACIMMEQVTGDLYCILQKFPLCLEFSFYKSNLANPCVCIGRQKHLIFVMIITVFCTFFSSLALMEIVFGVYLSPFLFCLCWEVFTLFRLMENHYVLRGKSAFQQKKQYFFNDSELLCNCAVQHELFFTSESIEATFSAWEQRAWLMMWCSEQQRVSR